MEGRFFERYPELVGSVMVNLRTGLGVGGRVDREVGEVG